MKWNLCPTVSLQQPWIQQALIIFAKELVGKVLGKGGLPGRGWAENEARLE